MDFLQDIINHKKEELILTKQELPEKKLRRNIDSVKLCSLKAQLVTKKPAIIAEIKRRSPSKGNLRNISDVREIAGIYSSSGAAAISVLTDVKYFGGSLEDLRNVKKSVSIPVLRKDFIIDPYQVYESKYYGADVILLITGCLEKKLFAELYELAGSLGLEVVVEVESIENIRKLEGLDIEIIGVNNRNLHTFEQSIDNSFELYSALPHNSIKITESGLSEAKQLTRLYAEGYRGFLIGETLMKSENPGETLKMLINEFNDTLNEKDTC